MRYEYWIETEDNRECRYWMVIESCSQCLFETLCRLEKTDSLVNKRKKSEKQWEEWEQVLDHNNK